MDHWFLHQKRDRKDLVITSFWTYTNNSPTFPLTNIVNIISPLTSEHAFTLPQRHRTQNQIQLLLKMICPGSLEKHIFIRYDLSCLATFD